MHDLLKDIRYALRAFTKAPGFTAVVVFILAVGIGLNTTIFTAVNAVLVRPLPYADAGRLVDLGTDWLRTGGVRQVMSYEDLLDIRETVDAFQQVGWYRGGSLNLSDGGGEPERLEGVLVSQSLLPMLGIAPRLGRTFTAEEEAPGGPRAVLLGDGLWRRRFGADRSVVGRSVTINGEPHTIVGVMPAGFAFPEGQQVWTPLRRESWFSRGNHFLDAVARLRPGVNLDQAQQQLTALMTTLAARYPGENTNKSASIAPLHSDRRRDVGVSLYAMMGAVAFVLLIACANVANLLLVRGAARQREIAVRTALGAGRWRLVRQLLTESVALALAGAVLGTVFAAWGIGLIDSVMPADRPWYIQLTFDWRVAAFTAALAVGSGLLFGLLPALQASRGDLTESLKEGGQGAGTSRARQRMRNALVVAEIALSVVLLAGASLMVRSFLALQSADPGFAKQGVLTARVYLAGSAYDDDARKAQFLDAVVGRLQATPGVAAAASVVNLPLGGSTSVTAVEAEGRPPRLGEEPPLEVHAGTGDFLQAMGLTLLRGRPFTPDEAADSSRHVVLLGETAARRLFPDADALGKRLRYARDTTAAWWQVVGIVRDVRSREIATEPMSQAWFPFHEWASRSVAIVVRASGDPRSLIAATRAAVGAQDPALPVYDVSTMQSVVEHSFWERKLFGQLFGTFGALALVLAAVGLYSVIAWSVVQRTREIGVRMALGAQVLDVMRMVVAGGMRLTLAGIVTGAGAALLVTGALRSLLYGVQPRDPWALALAAVVLALVALAATVVPARRATRIDPMTALRHE